MPKLDLTISISVIVALSAIISPILTAIINNHYQLKIKQMELTQQKQSNPILYQRKIYEKYLKYAGRCIYSADQDALKKYGEYYYLTLMYAPHSIKIGMTQANECILENDYKNAATCIQSVAINIQTLILQQKT